MKLNLRDLFWLIFVSAVVTMWWIDRSKLADRLKAHEAPKQPPFATVAPIEAGPNAEPPRPQPLLEPIVPAPADSTPRAPQPAEADPFAPVPVAPR